MQKHSTINLVKNLFVTKQISCVENIKFAKLTTIGCGGKIALVVYPKTTGDLQFVWKTVHQYNLPFAVLGRGSNVLASDRPFDGVVIVTTHLHQFSIDGQILTAQCGCMTATVSKYLSQHNYGGGEFLLCLPATIGGATVMNAGCFGQEISQIVDSVQFVDAQGNLHDIDATKCCFGYRNSIFKGNDNIIISAVRLKLNRVSYNVESFARDMWDRKKASQPLNEKSFGSAFFCKGVAVSKLIDDLGLKNSSVGGAFISEKHAGFIINRYNAKCQDILLLMQYIKNTIKQKYCYDITAEVRLIGEQWESDINDLGRLSYTYPQQ